MAIRRGMERYTISARAAYADKEIYMQYEQYRKEDAYGEESLTRTIDVIGLMVYLVEKMWIVLLTALIAAGLFCWGTSIAGAKFTATAKLYLANPEDSVNMADLQLSGALTMDYQEVFKTWEVHETVCGELGLELDYDEAQSYLKVTNPEGTHLLYVTVTYSDAQTAADIANAYAKAAKEFIIDVIRCEGISDFSIAVVPGTAFEPGRMSTLIRGFLLGGVLAAGVLLLVFVLDKRPRTPDDIRRYGGLPTLAVLPFMKKAKRAERKNGRENDMQADGECSGKIEIVQFPEPDHFTEEGLKTLAANLFGRGKDARRIMITSRYPGEGATYAAMNLMRMLAGLDKRVVLVDTDLRVSVIGKDYGLRTGRTRVCGLTDYLTDGCSFEEALHETSIPGAWMIPAGKEEINPFRLLQTEKMRKLLDRLNKEYDIVLVDTPSVGIAADVLALAKCCDGALLVVGCCQGRQKDIRTAAESIEQAGCRVLGAVLNGVRFDTLSGRHNYYHIRRSASHYRKQSRKRG